MFAATNVKFSKKESTSMKIKTNVKAGAGGGVEPNRVPANHKQTLGLGMKEKNHVKDGGAPLRNNKYWTKLLIAMQLCSIVLLASFVAASAGAQTSGAGSITLPTVPTDIQVEAGN